MESLPLCKGVVEFGQRPGRTLSSAILASYLRCPDAPIKT
jgi:hypothetical protein